MDATCDFQEEKKGRVKPQVMHIRLRIYHIFLSWSVSKTRIQSGLCVCVCFSEYVCDSESTTHSSMSCCVELCCAVKRSLNLIWCVSLTLCVDFIALLCCAALYCVSPCVSAVTWALIVHTYHLKH